MNIELFESSKIIFGIPSFTYVLLIYLIVLMLFKDLNYFKHYRTCINHIILSINKKNHLDNKYLWVFMMSFYTLFIINTLGVLGFPLILSHPAMTTVLSLFIHGICVFIACYENGLLNTLKSFVPHGIPGIIAPIIFIIEFVSTILKPFIFSLKIFLNNAINHFILHILSEIIPYRICKTFLVILIGMDFLKNCLQVYISNTSFINFFLKLLKGH